MSSPDITAYLANTPNGTKVSIALEELGIPYKAHELDLFGGEQSQDWFLAISPFGLMPALIDAAGPDGKPISIIESGNILQYLAERYDKEHKISYPAGSREAYEVNNWLFLHNATVSPKQTYAVQFGVVEPEGYAAKKFRDESIKGLSILEAALAKSTSGFIVGDHLSIADITFFTMSHTSETLGIDLSDFPHTKAWSERIAARPGVQRGQTKPFKPMPKMSVEERKQFVKAFYEKDMK
ncbi:Mitochondrial beta-keto-acyl synthase [Ascosphaera pollenicola]|nr:Mitochondrial beta-keto-acyl synthase [Ascosphaera pollenicola]